MLETTGPLLELGQEGWCIRRRLQVYLVSFYVFTRRISTPRCTPLKLSSSPLWLLQRELRRLHQRAPTCPSCRVCKKCLVFLVFLSLRRRQRILRLLVMMAMMKTMLLLAPMTERTMANSTTAPSA
jgi:hypothetical protein